MRAKEIQPKKLVVFDIDDTLVNTQTKVHVVKDGKVVNSLNSHDFTHYKLQPGESFDFEDFRNAR
jgi:FMN phosphatase YigB (HAD superfamily)